MFDKSLFLPYLRHDGPDDQAQKTKCSFGQNVEHPLTKAVRGGQVLEVGRSGRTGEPVAGLHGHTAAVLGSGNLGASERASALANSGGSGHHPGVFNKIEKT